MNNNFFSNIEEYLRSKDIFDSLETYATSTMTQMYVIKSPLGEEKYEYDYDDGILILIPKHKIICANLGEDNDEFEEYCEDLIEDLSHISDKFDYKTLIGRPRKWKNRYFNMVSSLNESNLEEVLNSNIIEDDKKSRNIDYLISLLTGSINDINRTGGDYPETLLDKIKKKIILFDSDQTRFIYEEISEKTTSIQGLAGTGKTELLMHKLKKIYMENDSNKVVLTCHNEVLADNLKKRIPEFFDFMRVNEQIKWEKRLWVMRGWGSKSSPNSGVYSYITNAYGLSFFRYSYHNNFEVVCEKALNELEKLEKQSGKIEPIFDYILIDESQDFNEAFFKLCEKVTRKKIYKAGDIFQNVFDIESISKVDSHFLLNKCYRTDPKTLMFAHGIGMGLFEDEPLRWLYPDEWIACGYNVEENDGYYTLSRNPIRRFEDISEERFKSVEIIKTPESEIIDNILEIIKKIREDNETVEPDDIGIMFLENGNQTYEKVNSLEFLIKECFDWDTSVGYKIKEKVKNTVFLSNRNNVKGLEFPFIICVMQGKFDKKLLTRNSLYMMLTRSFLKSYFIMSSVDDEIIEKLNDGIELLNREDKLSFKIQPEGKQKELRNTIFETSRSPLNIHDIIEEIISELELTASQGEKVREHVRNDIEDYMDKEVIKKKIEAYINYLEIL